MASGNRASMREGPLSQLFRKTEEGQQAAAEAAPPPEAPTHEPVPRMPTPQERLRHAFSSELPDNDARAGPAGVGGGIRMDAPSRPTSHASPSCAWSASAAAASTPSTG